MTARRREAPTLEALRARVAAIVHELEVLEAAQAVQAAALARLRVELETLAPRA